MKLFKRLLFAFIAVLFVFSATACSNAPKDIDIDSSKTVQKLIDGCQFDEKPAIIEDSKFAIETLFAVDLAKVAKDDNGNPIGCVSVCSSTPETVLIIKATDAEAAKSISEGAIKARTESYIHDYSNYGPEQVQKVETCINKVVGQYVFLIISSDNAAAEKLLDELIK